MEVRSRVASQLRIEGDTPTLENIGRTNQEALQLENKDER
jgi:hypothetical protein